jgi:hypothetical protein
VELLDATTLRVAFPRAALDGHPLVGLWAWYEVAPPYTNALGTAQQAADFYNAALTAAKLYKPADLGKSVATPLYLFTSTQPQADGFVASVSFPDALATPGATLLVDTGTVRLEVTAWRRVGLAYAPFEGSFGLAFYPGDLQDEGLPGWSDVDRHATGFTTGPDGRASVDVPSAALRDFEGLGQGNGFAVSVVDCSGYPPRCRTSFASFAANALLAQGRAGDADALEVAEPGTGLRPAATPLVLLRAP